MNAMNPRSAIQAARLLLLLPFCVLVFPVVSVGDERATRPTSAGVSALELERCNYGANEDRLQARSSDGQSIELAGKWQMSGLRHDGDTNIPFGSGESRPLPDMDDWQWHDVSVPGSIRSIARERTRWPGRRVRGGRRPR